jgi:hypothetical protein
MATKFSQIYKQELKSKGVLSSLGSAALKQRKERMDIRNVLFGGSGVVSATGQKIFGKGFSALGGAPKLSSDSPQQSAAINALTISSEKQEGLLKIVAKNTMNMNSMARDMNITRQNIASMTKKVAGKSSRGADALWMGAEKRNALLADKKTTPTNTNNTTESSGGLGGIFSGIGNILSGGAGLIGGVVSGLLGVVGKVGGGILGAIGSVLSGVPGGFILATVALAGVAYLLKQVSENVNFEELKTDILKGLGLDPNDKDRSLSEQILERIGFSRETSKKIINSTSDFTREISKIFEEPARIMTIYAKAAYLTLTDVFLGIGKQFGFFLNEFFQDNKGKILMAVTLGIGSGFVRNPASLAAVAAAVGAAGIFGATTSAETTNSLTEDLNKKTEGLKNQEKLLNDITRADPNDRRIAGRKQYIEQQRQLVDEARIKLDAKKAEQDSLMPNIRDRMNRNVTDLEEQYPKTKFTPQKIDSNSQKETANLILKRFMEAGFTYEQALGAIANASAESSLNPKASNVNPETKDDSHGLFQLNRRGGLGSGYSVEQLHDAETNIAIAIREAKKSSKFRTSKTVEDAARAFMEDVERPKDQSNKELQRRLSLPNFTGEKISSSSTELNDGTRTLSLAGAGSSAPTVINNNNTTNTSSGGTAVASSWNKDAAELFVTNAYA